MDSDEDEEAQQSGMNSKSECELQDCLELYQAAQDSLSPRRDSSRHRANSPASPGTHCMILRMFYHCINNKSRMCLGDLTFHSSHRYVQKQMRDMNCSYHGPTFPLTSPLHPWHSTRSRDDKSSEDNVCTHRRTTSHRYCSVFGDPHLVSFDDTHQTCKVIGAFPMIDNEYLSVQITSEAVNSEGASAVTKVFYTQ